MARGSSLNSPGRRMRVIILVYFIVSLFSCMVMLFPAQRDIHCTSMTQYSLFVLKVPLNNNKPNQTCRVPGYSLVASFRAISPLFSVGFVTTYALKSVPRVHVVALAVTEALTAPAQYLNCSGTRNLHDNLSDLRAQVAANQKVCSRALQSQFQWHRFFFGSPLTYYSYLVFILFCCISISCVARWPSG